MIELTTSFTFKKTLIIPIIVLSIAPIINPNKKITIWFTPWPKWQKWLINVEIVAAHINCPDIPILNRLDLLLMMKDKLATINIPIFESKIFIVVVPLKLSLKIISNILSNITHFWQTVQTKKMARKKDKIIITIVVKIFLNLSRFLSK